MSLSRVDFLDFGPKGRCLIGLRGKSIVHPEAKPGVAGRRPQR